MTITVPREEMYEILDNDEDVVIDELTSHSRWSVGHRMIFKKDGKLYETHYSVGATEQQDESPWEYDTDVECAEVVPVEKMHTEYVPVEEGAPK